MTKKPLALRVDPGLLERVDAARGDVSRTRFVERALEAAVEPAERPPLPEGVLDRRGENWRGDDPKPAPLMPKVPGRSEPVIPPWRIAAIEKAAKK